MCFDRCTAWLNNGGQPSPTRQGCSTNVLLCLMQSPIGQFFICVIKFCLIDNYGNTEVLLVVLKEKEIMAGFWSNFEQDLLKLQMARLVATPNE